VSLRTDSFDLGGMRLTSGEGRRLELEVVLDPYELGGERYEASPSPVRVRLDVSRTTGQGYALRLRFTAALTGPCMRCLQDAGPEFEVDAYEVSQPGGDPDELDSPYMPEGGILKLAQWAHDALALVLPATLLCRPDCAGLCPVCGVDLNQAGPEHHHEAAPDPRWAKLAELKLEGGEGS
jgi:uncharacterized protein